jgi:hypothetical protein
MLASAKSLQGASRSNVSPAPIAQGSLMTQERIKAQNGFIIAVTGKDSHSSALTLSYNWYAAFLVFKVKEAWSTLLSPVLAKVNTAVTKPCDHDISIAFSFLTAIVLQLDRKELALVEIVDEMYNQELLRFTDDDRSRANQLVFAALGWISMMSEEEIVLLMAANSMNRYLILPILMPQAAFSSIGQ